MGSTCIYPKEAPQPIKETDLLTGPLESTNQWYAIAKIAGMKLCQAYRKQHGCDFISAMPTNLYGPHDNFDHKTGMVIPSLIKKFCKNSKKVDVWGDGSNLRDFIYSKDVARAMLYVMYKSPKKPINLGSGTGISIRDLVNKINKIFLK